MIRCLTLSSTFRDHMLVHASVPFFNWADVYVKKNKMTWLFSSVTYPFAFFPVTFLPDYLRTSSVVVLPMPVQNQRSIWKTQDDGLVPCRIVGGTGEPRIFWAHPALRAIRWSRGYTWMSRSITSQDARNEVNIRKRGGPQLLHGRIRIKSGGLLDNPSCLQSQDSGTKDISMLVTICTKVTKFLKSISVFLNLMFFILTYFLSSCLWGFPTSWSSPSPDEFHFCPLTFPSVFKSLNYFLSSFSSSV